MSASKVSICNMALTNISHATLIQSLTEESREAQLCNLYYDMAFAEFMSDHVWSFGKVRAVLAEIGTVPTGWEYQYAYPSNCARIVCIYNASSDRDEDKIPFEVAMNSDGTSSVILTNEYQAELSYITTNVNVSLLPPKAVVTFSWLLSRYLAFPMTQSDKAVKAATDGYVFALSQATVNDAQGYHEDPIQQASWINAR